MQGSDALFNPFQTSRVAFDAVQLAFRLFGDVLYLDPSTLNPLLQICSRLVQPASP